MNKKNGCNDILSLVKSINDNPDNLHLDYTPSVLKLSECGMAAVVAVLPLMNSKDNMTRLRAQRVLEGVIKRRFGWRPGQGFLPGTDGEKKMDALMTENGSYRYDGSLKDREAAVKKWNNWLSQNKAGHE